MLTTCWHTPATTVAPVGQATHTELLQNGVAPPHARPHAPQLASLFWMSVQVPAQPSWL